MMSKNMDLYREYQRRSSISSSCPSSSFSSSTESSDSFATPSPSWASYNLFPANIKDFTNQAFNQHAFFADFSTAEEMDPFLMHDAIHFSHQPGPVFVGDPFSDSIVPDSIDPAHTCNHTASSPSTPEPLTYGFTFDGLKPDYEERKEAFFQEQGFSPLLKHEEKNHKLGTHRPALPRTPIGKKQKNRKCPEASIVRTGTFPCIFPGCTTTRKFRRAEHLKRHERIHDKSGKYYVYCQFDECGREFSRADNLRDHEKRHRNGDENSTKSKRVMFIPRAEEVLAQQERGRKASAGSSKPKSRTVQL